MIARVKYIDLYITWKQILCVDERLLQVKNKAKQSKTKEIDI